MIVAAGAEESLRSVLNDLVDFDRLSGVRIVRRLQSRTQTSTNCGSAVHNKSTPILFISGV
jgi:hypothetical protein